jgi:hypothetical protein
MVNKSNAAMVKRRNIIFPVPIKENDCHKKTIKENDASVKTRGP